MKLLLSLSLFACLFSSSLKAADSHYQRDLKMILEDTYLNAPDMSDYLYMTIIGKLQEAGRTAPPSTILERYKDRIASSPELQKKLLDIFAEEISKRDSKEVLALIQSPLYLKHRRAIQTANLRCWMESGEMIQKVIDEMGDEENFPIISNIIEVNSSNFHEVVNGSKYVVLDLYGPHCPPCKVVSAVFTELSQEYGHLYTFAAINCFAEQEIGERFGVQAVPTVVFMRDGIEVGRHVGLIGKEATLQLIKKYFNFVD